MEMVDELDGFISEIEDLQSSITPPDTPPPAGTSEEATEATPTKKSGRKKFTDGAADVWKNTTEWVGEQWKGLTKDDFFSADKWD